MKSAIIAIGTANPPYHNNQENLYQLVIALNDLNSLQQRLLYSVYKSTGITKRHSVLEDFCKKPEEFTFFPNTVAGNFPTTAQRMSLYKTHALTLALEAIKDCFRQVPQLNLQSITHLITVSCTGMYAPGLDIEIVQHLNLNSNTQRTAVNFMGCYGVFNALKLADSICLAHPSSKVLVVSVELCSLHFQKTSELSNLISNALFADGAAAVIVEIPTGVKKCLEFQAFLCGLIPQSHAEMTWHIGDQGFDMILSSYIPELIKSGISKFMQQLLHSNGLHLENIDYYAIHPGGKKILEACEMALPINKYDNRFSYQVMQNFGNMSSATILFVLNTLWLELTDADHNKTIFSCAFGPGLTLESMLLKSIRC